MANHGRYTREQEAETLVKVLSTMPHQDPRTSDRSGRRNRKPVIHDRVAEVLDELATICVSRPHQEPVAVGLQMQATEKKMTFVIAVERSLVKKTISHAKEVLKGLQELGHAYSKHRISVSSVERETSESSSEASVKSNGDYLPPELQKMELVWMAKIFRFSFAEIKHRLQKPCRVYFRKTMPRIDRFIELIGLLYPKLSDDHEVLSHFREVLTAMKVVKSILDMPSNHPDYKSDEAMSRLCGAMWYASYQATKIFGQEYWEAILADRLKIYGEVVNGKYFFLPFQLTTTLPSNKVNWARATFGRSSPRLVKGAVPPTRDGCT